MLVGEDLFVDELLHLVDLYHCSTQRVDCGILPVTQDSEEKMVRRNAVASGPHGLFTREVYYRIELV